MSSERTRLIFVRHGEPDEEMRGRCYGGLDVRLSERGRSQAHQLARELRASGATAVFSSPLTRATKTAQAIAAALGVQVQVRDDLREIGFGEFEGRHYEEIAATTPELYARWMTEPESVSFPDGENFSGLLARVSGEVARIRAERRGASSILVSHDGVIRAVLADALELKPSIAFRIAVAWASRTVIDWHNGLAVVKLVNGRVADSAAQPREP